MSSLAQLRLAVTRSGSIGQCQSHAGALTKQSTGFARGTQPGDDAGTRFVRLGQRIPRKADAIVVQPVIPPPRPALLARIDLLPRTIQPAERLETGQNWMHRATGQTGCRADLQPI